MITYEQKMLIVRNHISFKEGHSSIVFMCRFQHVPDKEMPLYTCHVSSKTATLECRIFTYVSFQKWALDPPSLPYKTRPWFDD